MDESTKQMVERTLQTLEKQQRLSALICDWLRSTGSDAYFPEVNETLVGETIDDELVEQLWAHVEPVA